MAKFAIDYEEKLYLALAALRGAGYTPVRLVLDRAARLGPTSVEWLGQSEGARALDLDIEFRPDAKPHILAQREDRLLEAPASLRKLARWLAADGGQREPLALVPAYRPPRLRVVR